MRQERAQKSGQKTEMDHMMIIHVTLSSFDRPWLIDRLGAVTGGRGLALF